MRKNKAMTALLACTLALQAPVAAGAAAPADNTAAKAVASSENTLQNAARKNGFKRENGKFYYYVNGVKLKNRWRWVKWYGKTYKALLWTHRSRLRRNQTVWRISSRSKKNQRCLLRL